jgi:hypothetical protein
VAVVNMAIKIVVEFGLVVVALFMRTRDIGILEVGWDYLPVRINAKNSAFISIIIIWVVMGIIGLVN